MKNKRGEIPITILVLGIVLVCILAIASFYVSSSTFNKNFDIQIVKEAKLAGEKADFYSNLGFTQEEIDSLLDIKPDSEGRYLLLERDGISVRYYLP